MRVAAFVLLSAVLAAGASARYTQPAFPGPKTNVSVNVMSTKSVIKGTLNGITNLPGKIWNGDFTVVPVGTATEPAEVTDVGCLNTVVPAPLNWGPLWCAGKEAKVMQWTDDVGTLHRTISIPHQQNVTANMVFWLFSPMFPQYLNFNGRLWYWYHLWHPMDHINAKTIAAPSSANPLLPGLYTLIHEHYRNLPSEKGMTEFETDCYFHVEDMMSNFLKKRIVISINTLTMQAWTLIVNLKDTPKGLKIDVEQILGAAKTGYDPTDPSKGAPAEAAAVVNQNLVKPTLNEFAPGEGEFARSLNAITRHVVEEFSMFRFFLPQVWEQHPVFAQMFGGVDWANSLVPRLNYGPHMTSQALDGTGMTEMMAPLNRTSLNTRERFMAVAGKMPQAIASGLEKNINSQLKRTADQVNGVLGAITDGRGDTPTRIVRGVVPSAAGAFPEPAAAGASA